MGLGPMEISGGYTRLNDFAQIKHAEDHKGAVDQSNFAGAFKKEVDDRSTTVKRANDLNNNQKKFDAKEKGSNEYTGDGGKKRGEAGNFSKDGKVLPKGTSSGFDIRI